MFNGIQPQDVAQFAGNYYIAVRNMRWLNAERTLIDCQVNFNHVGFEEWTPFCADPNDYMPYSKQIFDECVAGKWGPIAEYISPVVYDESTVIEAAANQPISQGAQTL
jgi:hypothetical protein